MSKLMLAKKNAKMELERNIIQFIEKNKSKVKKIKLSKKSGVFDKIKFILLILLIFGYFKFSFF